jgi:hypothetical protein
MSLIEKMQSRLDDANEQARASCVDRLKAESELFALGVQVEALKARLKLAEACVETLRKWNKYDRDVAAFDAVPGDVGADVEQTDPRPRYASGEVPMVGDDLTLVRRAAPPAPSIWEDTARKALTDLGTCGDQLARAVDLLREHAYDVRVRDFLADFDNVAP